MSEDAPEVAPDEAPPVTEPPKATKRTRKKAAAPTPPDGVPVDDYPERSYLDAVTPEHRKALEEWGQLPEAG